MVWGFIITLVVSFALSFLLTPKPKDQKPSGLNEFNIPTAKLGRDIPVLFGRRVMKGANCVWYGDLKAKAIRKRSGFSKVVVGHKYYIGMHLVLCHAPSDGESITLHEIWIGDQLKWSGSSSGGAISIDGVGTVDFLPGDELQGQNAYLASKLGPDVPAFRGIASVVLRQVYIGDSPYMENWSFVVSRVNNSWQSTAATVGLDMGPVHIIREVFTNRSWGLGYNPEDIDDTTFANAASTLKTEGLGLSMVWDRATEISDFIPEILRHIDGSIFIDRSTGRFRIKLVRDDYDLNLLPMFDETNISKLEKFKIKQQSEVINTVSVKYHKRESRDDGSITVQDSALVADMGGTVSSSNDYPAITTDANAANVAWRDLRALSIPFSSCTITTTRDGSTLNPGDPFLLTWARLGIDSVIMRVASISRKNNEIRIDCVQDIFGGASAIIAPPPSSGWVSPVNEPSPVVNHAFFEAPYHWLIHYQGQTVADTVKTTTDGYIAITAEAPTPDATGAELWIDGGTGYVPHGDAEFCEVARLTSAVGIIDTVLAVDFPPSEFLPGSWALLDAEIVRLDSITGNSITVGRGCLDTVPTAHDTGAALMFAPEPAITASGIYQTGETISAKLLTETSLGILGIDSASVAQLTFANRAIRPYPPAKLRIDTEPEPVEVGGNPVISWASRNRLTQIAYAIADTEDASITAEPGTTYSITIKRADTLATIYSASGLTTLSDTVTSVGGYIGDVILEVWAVRDGYDSWQKQQREFYSFIGYNHFYTSENHAFLDSTGAIFLVEA